jgi:hypothetical protein
MSEEMAKLASDSGSDSDSSTFTSNLDPRSATTLAALLTAQAPLALQVLTASPAPQDPSVHRPSPAPKRAKGKHHPFHPRQNGIAERTNSERSPATWSTTPQPRIPRVVVKKADLVKAVPASTHHWDATKDPKLCNKREPMRFTTKPKPKRSATSTLPESSSSDSSSSDSDDRMNKSASTYFYHAHSVHPELTASSLNSFFVDQFPPFQSPPSLNSGDGGVCGFVPGYTRTAAGHGKVSAEPELWRWQVSCFFPGHTRTAAGHGKVSTSEISPGHTRTAAGQGKVSTSDPIVEPKL